MYTLKKFFVFSLFTLFVGSVFAQDDQNTFDKDFKAVMSDMSDEQKKTILVHAFRMADVDFDEEMPRLLEMMSDQEKERLLKFANAYKKFKKPNQRGNTKKAENRSTTESEVPPPPPPPPAPQSSKKAEKPVPSILIEEMPSGPVTVMEFEDREFDFGTIQQGEKVSYTYTFKNTGDEPLIISNAKGSCGCTVPQWPKEAIGPGEMGEIKVVFNSGRKKGQQMKSVAITANTNPPKTTLIIKGKVAVPTED